MPGLHLKLPFTIETVTKVRVTHVFKEEFGFKTLRSGSRTGSDFDMSRRGAYIEDPFLAESLMLTGDLNIAVVEWIVQYKIQDPVKYLFRMRNVENTLRSMSEAVMRQVVGDYDINQVLTQGRENIRIEAQEKLQVLLDKFDAGIVIDRLLLQNVTPPEEVKPSFNAVNEARQEKDKLINQAWQAYNQIIPRAKGEALQQIREAEGYATERVNRAKGEAAKFSSVLKEYEKAKDVTRRRLYLETINQALPQVSNRAVVDQDIKGVLPFLNLSEKKTGHEESPQVS
jgi:membrane protease subunit HflK